MATTYTELQAEIQSWLDSDNTNLVAAIPTFITDAEVRLSRNLRTWEMECYIYTPLVPADVVEATLGMYALPADYAGVRSLNKVGDQLGILYLQRIPHLSDTRADNWLLLKHPDLYRFASLYSAEGFLKDDPRVPLWAAKADGIIEEIHQTDPFDKYPHTPLRSRTVSDNYWEDMNGGENQYAYLAPQTFWSLDSGSISPPGAGYYTIADRKFHIWPKPEMPTP